MATILFDDALEHIDVRVVLSTDLVTVNPIQIFLLTERVDVIPPSNLRAPRAQSVLVAPDGVDRDFRADILNLEVHSVPISERPL